MFRKLYFLGSFLGAIILTLLIGARLINSSDPYRKVTEDLIQQVAAEPQRTVRLNEYSSLAIQMRQMLHTEAASNFANWLNSTGATTIVEKAPVGQNVKLIVWGVDTAVHQIAVFDEELEAIEAAEKLSRDLAQLRFYDLDRGDAVLFDLYRQSRTVSGSLSDVSEGMGDVATAIASVTSLPAVTTFHQELGDWLNTLTNVASISDDWAFGTGVVDTITQLANIVYWSIDSWQGIPSNMMTAKQRIDSDVVWLVDFEQQYREARTFNDRWHFDTLRLLPRFVAEFYRPLLLGLAGSLMMAVVGWAGHIRSIAEQRRQSTNMPRRQMTQPALSKPNPRLAFSWPDGRRESQALPQIGELTIGNIVIRRARVRYYLELIDNAFPAHLNGNSICSARILSDGDVLQIGELQTVFQLAA